MSSDAGEKAGAKPPPPAGCSGVDGGRSGGDRLAFDCDGLHLPLSFLLQSLLEDTNSALAKFVEDQTVNRFLPVPSRRHLKYYPTSSSSFPGLFTVPPGLASIILEKVSESRVPLTSLLFGDYALECVRGHPLAGLVAVDLRGFLRASNRRSVWQLRAIDALWFESPKVPWWPGCYGSRKSHAALPRFPPA